MDSDHRFFLSIFVVAILSVLVASGNIAGARALGALVIPIALALGPRGRFGKKQPEITPKKGMTSRATTRHSNRIP